MTVRIMDVRTVDYTRTDDGLTRTARIVIQDRHGVEFVELTPELVDQLLRALGFTPKTEAVIACEGVGVVEDAKPSTNDLR